MPPPLPPEPFRCLTWSSISSLSLSLLFFFFCSGAPLVFFMNWFWKKHMSLYITVFNPKRRLFANQRGKKKPRCFFILNGRFKVKDLSSPPSLSLTFSPSWMNLFFSLLFFFGCIIIAIMCVLECSKKKKTNVVFFFFLKLHHLNFKQQQQKNKNK